jgi:hypothetical protein
MFDIGTKKLTFYCDWFVPWYLLKIISDGVATLIVDKILL